MLTIGSAAPSTDLYCIGMHHSTLKPIQSNCTRPLYVFVCVQILAFVYKVSKFLVYVLRLQPLCSVLLRLSLVEINRKLLKRLSKEQRMSDE